uniref:DUF3861 domain-containing protein n=1 Tax=Thaumasiovibrio occultus TaxID=1891184 RepID=UPI000B35DA35|nr:DUF3861 domain-containing protein [Thaumasiovibrio occultus]
MAKEHSYRITIEEIEPTEAPRRLQFEIKDREDMLSVVEKIQQGSGLDNSTATRLGVGLRLLGPTMMENRKHPFFSEFMPHFKSFMIKLKATVKGK